jgi:putative Mg2+ transporter-C (MgtC) family protein
MFPLKIFFDLQIISLLSAGVCGALIGIEREARDKGAGIRTHTLVSLGSCLFTIISVECAKEFGGDPSRIAAQIVSGIGFLGGGAILQERDKVRGLTTAATIWISAAMGMACGLNRILEGLLVAVITLGFLLILRNISKRVRRPRLTWLLTVKFLDEMTADSLSELEGKIEMSLNNEGFRLLELTEKSSERIELVVRGQGKLSALTKHMKAAIGKPIEIELREF